MNYCEDLVRKADYEGFLSTQFFPTKKEQQTQLALRAFNIELASIREHVSRSDIGRMRMQFWRDNLEKIFAGHPPQQPTALALAYAIQEEEDPNKQLSTIWLKRMITERERNLSDPQFMTLAEMETYSENTLGSLFYLQLESVGVRSLEADHAASHLGKAMGIATLLRAFRFHMLQNRMILPAEITAKHGISQEALFRNPTVTAALQDATLEVATAAHVHLATAKSFCKSLPHQALPVMMAGIPTESFLQRLEKEDFNPLAPSLMQREWFLPAKMWYRWRKSEPFGPYDEARGRMKKNTSSVSLRTWVRNTPWKRHLKDGAKAIVQSPLNFLVFFLALNVVFWGAFLVLLLGKAVQFESDAKQKLWIEISSQVINAIFTLAAVPVHPKRFMGLVRAVTIWRRERGLRTQFLSLFLEKHHQTRLAQHERDNPHAPPLRTLKESEKELLDMVDYFNAFPEYGRGRGTKGSSNKISQHGHISKPMDADPYPAPTPISPSLSYTNTNTNTAVPMNSVPRPGPRESAPLPTPYNDNRDNAHQHPNQQPPPPKRPSVKTRRTTLHVDIPEQALDTILAQETERVVHSVVLPFLPTTPTLGPGHGPTLGAAFIEDGSASPRRAMADPSNTSSTTPPSGKMTPSGTQSSLGSRRSTRTRARTRTMIMATESDVTNDSMAVAETVAATPKGNHSGNNNDQSTDGPQRGSLPRRPTFVVLEARESPPPGQKDPSQQYGGSDEKKQDSQVELPLEAAFLAEEEVDEDADRASEICVALEPFPLTLEQIEWLDERQSRLMEQKARLQHSWPWYTYTMPAGIEPVDFMAACKTLAPAPSSSSSSSSLLSLQQRSELIQSPTAQLLMRASKASLILFSFNLNSIIQEILCGFMWGWPYLTRPGAVVGVGVALGCTTALIPTIAIFLHERRLSQVRAVATAEEAIQEAIDSQPQLEK
ncbi:NADH dehydrogenase (ubiquinone) complex I, assembly factor 6 [Actinomortierella ambigua]|nr:NADH dehydrogenase (ubiquinone) complex I, assembly factor 6 [Actinomortierella ambigua]